MVIDAYKCGFVGVAKNRQISFFLHYFSSLPKESCYTNASAANIDFNKPMGDVSLYSRALIRC
jgi:hypothetical protein